jgi:hypothetical protein
MRDFKGFSKQIGRMRRTCHFSEDEEENNTPVF